MLRHCFIKKKSFLLLFLLLLGRPESIAAADGLKSVESQGPLSIAAKKMVVQNLEDKIIFEGDVLIRKGDLKIKAARAEVFLTQKDPAEGPKSSSFLFQGSGSKGEKEVLRIILSGNVDIQQGDKRAKAQNGTYERAKEEIVLTGDPEAWENDFHVKGKTITLFLAENRTLVSESELVIQSGVDSLKFNKK
ncbi:MAG: LptA/OstA family protein [Nitrospiria bacterium]